MDECKNRAPGSLEWKEEEASMDETEKIQFEKVMGDLSMPDDTGPDYDAWLFHKSYQSRQPEIDALKFDRKVLRSLYSNASREIERLRVEADALKAENEKLRKGAEGVIMEWFGDGSYIDMNEKILALRGAMTAHDTKGE